MEYYELEWDGVEYEFFIPRMGETCPEGQFVMDKDACEEASFELPEMEEIGSDVEVHDPPEQKYMQGCNIIHNKVPYTIMFNDIVVPESFASSFCRNVCARDENG